MSTPNLPDKLAPGRSIELAITATFPQVGDYHGELVLYRGTVQRVVPVAIKVEDPSVTDASLVEHGHAIIALEETWDGDAKTSVQVELRNTGTHELTLAAPRVVAARRVDKVDKPTRESQLAAARRSDDPCHQGVAVGGPLHPLEVHREVEEERLEVRPAKAGSTPSSTVPAWRGVGRCTSWRNPSGTG